ncbi:MAG: HAMP domain-containing sensor histidine kinase [Actinomycetota bacterium]
MGGSDEPTREQLGRRLERERRARQSAEAVAEEATSRLYTTLEELKSLNDSMRDFVAIAAHDLRSPLAAVSGFAGLLSESWDDLDDEARRDMARRIESSSQSIVRLAEDLLTVSRIEAGALDTKKQVIDLATAITDATENFRDHASEIKIVVDAGLRIEADPVHLERIVANFVGNAFKYGEPPVEIEASACDGWAEIRIKDHGEGVPKDFVPRLFGRFARAAASAQIRPGTGLGLSIVRGLAQANGGEVWYEPNEPNGSCFALRLPRAA